MLMRSVRRQDTAPELALRRFLHAKGFRYRLHVRGEPGTPDLLLPRRGTAIFVHGCFWHGHTCSKASKPKSNAGYWEAKITGNKARDRRHQRALRALGWRVLTIYECAAQPSRIARLTPRLLRFLEA